MQRDWPERYPIAQFPNAPLLVGLGAGVVARLTDGDVHDVAFVVSRAGIVVFAVLEVVSGVNLFRRALGVAVLAWVVFA